MFQEINERAYFYVEITAVPMFFTGTVVLEPDRTAWESGGSVDMYIATAGQTVLGIRSLPLAS